MRQPEINAGNCLVPGRDCSGLKCPFAAHLFSARREAAAVRPTTATEASRHRQGDFSLSRDASAHSKPKLLLTLQRIDENIRHWPCHKTGRRAEIGRHFFTKLKKSTNFKYLKSQFFRNRSPFNPCRSRQCAASGCIRSRKDPHPAGYSGRGIRSHGGKRPWQLPGKRKRC